MRGVSERVWRLLNAIADDLAEADEVAVHELRVRVARSDPMSVCPPGVTESHWCEVRREIGDPDMRRRLWSVLADLEARRR